MVAVYKPAGWLVHRTGLDAGETRFVMQTLRDQLGQHVYPVHRLDKGTCGVLAMALDRLSARALGEAFATQQVKKRYLAFVRGWAPPSSAVDHALRPDDAAPGTPAQSAHTQITCLARLELPEASDARHAQTRASLVLAEPATGRRHQIRRHLKHISHPIIGDATHGKGPLNRWWAQRLGMGRLWLHAWQLTLPHPQDGRPLTIDSGVRWPMPSVSGPANFSGSANLQDACPAAPHLRAWQQGLLTLPWLGTPSEDTKIIAPDA